MPSRQSNPAMDSDAVDDPLRPRFPALPEPLDAVLRFVMAGDYSAFVRYVIDTAMFKP